MVEEKVSFLALEALRRHQAVVEEEASYQVDRVDPPLAGQVAVEEEEVLLQVLQVALVVAVVGDLLEERMGPLLEDQAEVGEDQAVPLPPHH